MAISQNFLTGRMRKSAGGARFSTWRGLNVVASKPMVVRQNVTQAVKLNREKMVVVGKLVSKMNTIVNDLYSLGIAKTTPFADTVKFFRSRLLDSLRLDASLLAGASFGTSNIPSPSYVNSYAHVISFGIDTIDVPSILDGETVQSYVIVMNDSCTKVGIYQVEHLIDDTITLDLSGYGFVAGDKVAFAAKPVRFRPGADLSGKMKFMSSSSFITLTA